MSNTRRKLEKQRKRCRTTLPHRMELSRNSNVFFPGLINQVSTSFDAKIDKLNEESTKCNKNYHDMRLELKNQSQMVVEA
jgi:hypothetical protein